MELKTDVNILTRGQILLKRICIVQILNHKTAIRDIQFPVLGSLKPTEQLLKLHTIKIVVRLYSFWVAWIRIWVQLIASTTKSV